uniref:E3 ubiquitin-protein ligase TRIM33 n=1 Tax=Rhabditophanes sp. KR3021 TaxID=114890 RepID=A0AC35TS00_9BILA
MSESDSLAASSAGSDVTDPFQILLNGIDSTNMHSFTPFQNGMCTLGQNGQFEMSQEQPLIKEQSIKCPICNDAYKTPKVLACFHSFCKGCIENKCSHDKTIIECPTCHQETKISVELGVDGLLNDFGLENAQLYQRHLLSMGRSEGDGKDIFSFGSPTSTSSSPLSETPSDSVVASFMPSVCGSCKSGDNATAHCKDCKHFLCEHCTSAHKYMHLFSHHRVETITSKASSPIGVELVSQCKCLEHKHQSLCYFCLSCNLAICQDCAIGHTTPDHNVKTINSVAETQMEMMDDLINKARLKQKEVLEKFNLVDTCQKELDDSFRGIQNTINENAAKLMQLVQENRKAILQDLDNAYGYRQLQLTMVDKNNQKMTRKMAQTIEFTQRLLKFCTPAQVMVFKPLLDNRLNGFLNFNGDHNNLLQKSCEIGYAPVNISSGRQAVINLMGSIKVPADWSTPGEQSTMMPTVPIVSAPIPTTPVTTMVVRPGSRNVKSPPGGHFTIGSFESPSINKVAEHHFGSSTSIGNAFNNNAQNDSGMVGSFPTINSNHLGTNNFPIAASYPYEKWSTNVESNLHNGLSLDRDYDSCLNNVDRSDIHSLGVQNVTSGFPLRSQTKRQKMSYHCKFGEFGVSAGQFTEPSGVAVNARNEIVVADTNNHRIQVFDKEGRFKFQFGECGKKDGQLLYPNRVAVNKATGDFIVTERSPTHQIQVYNQYGQFLRKFGANILQHPRGVCVDSHGRIIVVECKVMRVIIFDIYGNVVHKFSCSRYLEFPNGVCTNENEILISDNRAHCIKVFNYEGQYIRQIGGEGITNYPIGVGINAAGEVVVADNHNNFNLTVFSQEGEMLSALESKVKHAQCFDVALVEDGSVVLASKDYRLYLYRYQQCGNPI